MDDLVGTNKAELWRSHLDFLDVDDESGAQLDALVATMKSAAFESGTLTFTLSVDDEEMFLHLGAPEPTVTSDVPGVVDLCSQHGWIVLTASETSERFGDEESRVSFLGCVDGELVGSDYYESFEEADADLWVASIEIAAGENGYIAWNKTDQKWAHLDAETLDNPDELSVNDDVRRILSRVLGSIAAEVHYLRLIR